MSDSYRNPQNAGDREGSRGGSRGNRGPGNQRDTGGFRIRLSDNEMRSARSLQEAFNLRSTVAVLGFALRTLAQMLEEGKLQEILERHNSQEQRVKGRKDNNFSQGSKRNKFNEERELKPNPFARPEKPQQEIKEAEVEVEAEIKAEGDVEVEVTNQAETIESSDKSEKANVE